MRINTCSMALLAGLTLCGTSASAVVTIDWVLVGEPGNPPDAPNSNCYAGNCGAVAYAYRISKYEVTNAQYAEFLNAKADSDPYGLFNQLMQSEEEGGVVRGGASGSYVYAAKAGFGSKPVAFVSFWDAVRFANWLHNGQGDGDTESGAYTLLGGTTIPSNGDTVTRNPGATVFVPSENEWYKAAYYGGDGVWFDYPAGSDAVTQCARPHSALNTANCSFHAGGFTDVGRYLLSASPSGTFDQGGNVSEWNETIMHGRYRGFRGGGWQSSPITLATEYWAFSNAEYPDYGYGPWGFRVALTGDYECADSVDNDGDGLADLADPGCSANGSTIEDPQCQDGRDNDAQTGIDFDGGASLDLDGDGFIDAAFNPATPAVTSRDPQCVGKPYLNKEAVCGLGSELAFLLPPLILLRSRRRCGRGQRRRSRVPTACR